MTIEGLLAKMKKINLAKIESEGLKELEPEMIDLNVSQLARGEGKSGSKLPEYANPDYFAAKRAEGLTEQAGTHYNILLSGDTRSGMLLKKEGNNHFLTSTNEKVPRLNQLTNNDIFGLQKKSKDELKPEFEQLICDSLEKAMS